MKNVTTERTIDNSKTVHIKIKKPYIVPLLAAHCKSTYNKLGIDPVENAPIELISCMGIARKRFNNLLNYNEQPLLCETIAYFDFISKRGHIKSISELYEVL